MRGRSEKGIALIAVLWAVTLLSVIAAYLCLQTHTSTRIARNMADNAAARAEADAGIQRAILDLLGSLSAQPDAGKFRADGTVYAWRFANSTVYISIQDEASKINLNFAPSELLATFFDSVGFDTGTGQSLADAIADFRNANNLQGSRYAETAGLGWGPKNAPFEAVEELQQVPGMTAEIYGRVAPYVTIYSAPGVGNPTGALRQASFNPHYSVHSPEIAYSIRTEVKGSNGALFVREAVVQLFPQSTIPVVVLAWRQSAPTTSHRTSGIGEGQ